MMDAADDLDADAALARAVADEAGALLLDLRAKGLTGCGPRGDRAANDLILARLRAARPDDFILSEEAADDRSRCGARRVWIVDPLDGTREFADGRDDWAVHVGLAIDGRPAAGAVALPALGQSFDTGHPPAPGDAPPGPPRILISRTRPPQLATQLASALGGSLTEMGSAGAKAMAVVAGRADIYFHQGGQSEWDNCAPVAVALAAGFHASRVDGAALVYNCADPSIPDLLICRPEWVERALAVLASAHDA